MRPFVIAACMVGLELVSASVLAAQRPDAEQKTETIQRREPRPKPKQKPKSSGLKLREKLKQRIDIKFADLDIREAVRALGELSKLNIVLDARALEEIERRGSPVKVNIRLKDVPLEAALSAIVRSVGLNYAVYDYFVYVSTSYRIRHEPLTVPRTRIYRMRAGANASLPKIAVRNPGGPQYRGGP